MSAYFTPAAFKFLEGLARHNDRTWFEARRQVYETELRQPMLRLIEDINAAMTKFAPEYVRDPARSMMRIYRDIRFSKDKRPYKTNIAAWWARRGLEKISGGGFYLEISTAAVVVAAGIYMPERDQLLAVRRMLLERHEAVRAALDVSSVSPAMLPFEGHMLARAPKGFPPDHPAADLIRQRQWGLISSLPAEAALQATLRGKIVKRLQLAMPLVTLLNDGIAPAAKQPVF